MTLYKFFVFFVLSIIFQNVLIGQKPAFLTDHNIKWVDSVFNSLSLDEKIGQLLMPRGNYSGKPHDIETLEKWVKDYKVGGIVFFATNPTTQVILTNRLQATAKTPLLIGQDFEWGVGMRLDSTDRFPYAVALGAMQGEDHLIEAMGIEVAKQCKRIGVHINYAPVVDVNNNPNNPVINFRSFGENQELVARKGLAYMKGMQSQHLFCTAKHFPGHGDTDVDSHLDLPLINHDKNRLMDVELYPFIKLIKSGLSGIMTAHLSIPALEPTPKLAATFSKNIVYKLLREELKFEGLTFTDAMEMEGAVKNFPKGQAMVMAILAGNDILETFMDVPSAVGAIREAISNGRISMEVLNRKVKKILMAKSWVGLDQYKAIQLDHLKEDLNTIEADVLNHYFAEKSITCLRNSKNILPISDFTKKFAIVSLESADESVFSKMILNYVTADFFHIPKNSSDSVVSEIIDKMKNYDYVLFGIHLIDIRASKKYGLSPENSKHIGRFAMLNNVIICLLGNPFILDKIPEFSAAPSLMLGYQQNKYTESAVVQAIFGGISVSGRLPLTVNKDFIGGMGVSLSVLNRLSYGVPEMVGLDRKILSFRIDSVIISGLKEKAYPGGVVQVTKDSKVIYQKAYGYHRYEDYLDDGKPINEFPQYTFIDDAMDNFSSLNTTIETLSSTKMPQKGKVSIDDIFDLASITKITTSTLAVMQLMSEKKFNLNAKLSDYYPYFLFTNKANLTFRDMLTHRSGLKAWIPFWKNAIDTIATMKKALILNPGLENKCIVTLKKPGFFKRLFGKKSVKTIHYLASLQADSLLWTVVLNPKTISWKNFTFSHMEDQNYTIQTGDHLWLHKEYNKVMLKAISDSPLNIETVALVSQNGKYAYVYSDLHFYLYPEIIKRLTGMTMPSYLEITYKKLGANTLGYNPSFPLDRIVPTEYDSLFRQNLIHGRVHDEGSAMLDGISGHAGLFGNANDLTKLMQMYLQKGRYGGDRFIDSTVVMNCTSYQFPGEKNRRGIGFDKKDFDPKVKNAPGLASDESYGHSGYTGTYTWVDPKYNLIYVFLSNRVYPTRENIKISTLNIRTEIGNQIIKTIAEGKN